MTTAQTPVRNTARYCDGLTREFTARFTALGHEHVVYAAIAGTTCSDPLDCLAMTESEAQAATKTWLPYYRAAVGEVIPLPEGWRND